MRTTAMRTSSEVPHFPHQSPHAYAIIVLQTSWIKSATARVKIRPYFTPASLCCCAADLVKEAFEVQVGLHELLGTPNLIASQPKSLRVLPGYIYTFIYIKSSSMDYRGRHGSPSCFCVLCRPRVGQAVLAGGAGRAELRPRHHHRPPHQRQGLVLLQGARPFISG